jgi:hypothetical protein
MLSTQRSLLPIGVLLLLQVTFTGSTSVGRGVGEKAGGGLKAYTLELGGKSPVVVCPDADADKVVEVQGFRSRRAQGLGVITVLGFRGGASKHTRWIWAARALWWCALTWMLTRQLS